MLTVIFLKASVYILPIIACSEISKGLRDDSATLWINLGRMIRCPDPSKLLILDSCIHLLTYQRRNENRKANYRFFNSCNWTAHSTLSQHDLFCYISGRFPCYGEYLLIERSVLRFANFRPVF